MILLGMKAWELATQSLPAEEDRTEAWKGRNNRARSEIHLNCNLEQQDLIEDSNTTYDSWKILQFKLGDPMEQNIKTLQKEFASVMTEDDCEEYIQRGWYRSGEEVRDEDVAYTI